MVIVKVIGNGNSNGNNNRTSSNPAPILKLTVQW